MFEFLYGKSASRRASPRKTREQASVPAAPKPSNEKDRLRALSEYRILGTKPEESFDNITSMAAMICHAPIALISLVDEDRQWFKSRVGCEQLETERDISFCAHSILSAKPLIVEDALFDKRFSDNPLVHKEPHIRLYAGFPLSTPSHHRIGTLCVIDRIPKSLTSVQVQVMQRLANQVVTLLELRRKSLALLDEFCRLQENSGLICSCSYCRKIRDGNGAWQSFEDYMMRHSSLNFSHGICEGCMEEHFPEVSQVAR